jgi:MFS family permease
MLLAFLVGFTVSTPSSIIPELQQETFGDNSFVIQGGFAAGKGILGAAVIPVFGAFSDITGRRVALCTSQVLAAIPFVAMLVSGQNYWVYAFCNTFLGWYDATVTLLLAAAVDAVPASHGVHTENFSIVIAAFFLGISLAPFLGAYLSVEVTFIACCGTSALFLAITWFAFPKDNRASSMRGPNLLDESEMPAVTINSPPSFAVPSSPPLASDEPKWLLSRSVVSRIIEAVRAYPSLWVLSAIIFANAIAENVLDQLFLLYLFNTLNFSANEQAAVISIMGIGSVFGLILVANFLRPRIGSVNLLRLELAVNVGALMLYSVVRAHWGILATTSFGVIGMGAYPCASAIASMILSDDASGTAQGLASSSRMIAGGIAPLAFGFIFDATTSTSFPGAAFLIAAACVAISLALTWLLPRHLASKQK